MQKRCISKDWRFHLDRKPQYEMVDLPHDYSILQPRDPGAAGGAGNGYFPCGFGEYVKFMRLDAPHCILDIDGAYMNASVCLNEHLLALHPHGYTPFLVDLTEKMWPGKTNKIAISTTVLQPSTRWYSGAGLYRDVFLWTGGAVRVEPWDVFVTTIHADQTAQIRIQYQICSDKTVTASVRTEIRDPEGRPVAEHTDETAVSSAGKSPLTVEFTIPQPQLWDLDHPVLYTVHTEITAEGEITDTADTAFGIRTISVDAKNGFRLNGHPMKLRGGCIHHDHGVLGAASFPAAEERKLRRLKETGFNAVRIAHNPPSLALLECCDRIGMLVMDEAFDMWNSGKTLYDYHLWFADWCARDLSYMVQRDRNHPCVISYSIGNEIIERDGMSDGAEWAVRLAAEVRRYDTTRPVTSGVCDLWNHLDDQAPADYQAEQHRIFRKEPVPNGEKDCFARSTEAYMAPLDMVGYNYLYGRYRSDHQLYPERVIWGSETQALDFYDSWHAVLENNHVIGDFTWTAYDNLGEAGTGRSCWMREGYIPRISTAAYPWRTCYQGDLDLCGYRRPQSYFREAVWIGHTEPRIFTTHPMHYGEGFSGTHWHWYDVLDTWTFPDEYLGKPVQAEVYTDADEIEWCLNGRTLGRSKPEKGIARFDIPYEKGTLDAVAYRDGRECGKSSLHTVGTAAAIRVEAERASFHADRRDLCYFDITIVDENGDRVPDAKTALRCQVNGGELMGIFSGDPKNEDSYTSDRAHAFEGRALAIVRTADPGCVTVTIHGESLQSGSASTMAE